MVPCAHVPGAGRCPNASTAVLDVMSFFDVIYVICTGKNCKRHEAGYWRKDVQEKIRIVRGVYDQKNKRLNNFNLHLDCIKRGRGHETLLILEDDLRPVARHSLTHSDASRILSALRRGHWEVLRLASYPRLFSIHHRSPTCPYPCRCESVVPRLCQINDSCDMRNTEAYAVHRNAFSKFPVQYEGYLWYDQWLNYQGLVQYFVIPQLFVQQIKQGEVYTTETFAKKCVSRKGLTFRVGEQ